MWRITGRFLNPCVSSFVFNIDGAPVWNLFEQKYVRPLDVVVFEFLAFSCKVHQKHI